MENSDDQNDLKVVMLSISSKCFAVVEKLNAKVKEQSHFILSWNLEQIEQNEASLTISE